MGFRFYMAFFFCLLLLLKFLYVLCALCIPFSVCFCSVRMICIGYGKIQLRGNGFSIFLVTNLLFCISIYICVCTYTIPVTSNSTFFFYFSTAFDSCITKAKAACKFGFKKGELLWSFSLHVFSLFSLLSYRFSHSFNFFFFHSHDFVSFFVAYFDTHTVHRISCERDLICMQLVLND